EVDIEWELANTVKNAHETRELAKECFNISTSDIQRHVCFIIFYGVSWGDLAYRSDAPFYGCDVGDYIAMGQDVEEE
ncbi:hypothetical protein L7F22_027942, partial [Adiantum nelumboides]|nr:hypothetical protein [Adiantum nelumboides]